MARANNSKPSSCLACPWSMKSCLKLTPERPTDRVASGVGEWSTATGGARGASGERKRRRPGGGGTECGRGGERWGEGEGGARGGRAASHSTLVCMCDLPMIFFLLPTIMNIHKAFIPFFKKCFLYIHPPKLEGPQGLAVRPFVKTGENQKNFCSNSSLLFNIFFYLLFNIEMGLVFQFSVGTPKQTRTGASQYTVLTHASGFQLARRSLTGKHSERG